MKIRHLIASILVCTLPFAISCEGPEELTPEENGGNTETPVDPDDPSGEENPDEEDPQPEEPEITHYTLVAEAMEDWSGEYLIAFKGSERILVFGAWDEDTYGQPASENGSEINFMTYLEAEGIPVEKGDPYRSVIEKVGSHYSINVSNVGYIGYTGSENSLSRTETAPTASDTEYLWDITYSDDIRLTNAGSTDRRLQWNNSAPRFVAYKGSQQELTLYRRGAVSGLPVDPGTDPDDPGTDPDDPDDPAIDPDNPDPDDPVTDPDGPNDVGWFELPVITDEDGNGIKDDDNTLYYAYHLCDGNETYGSTGRKARNYTVCYSAEHHCPLWVAAPRHDMYEIKNTERTDAYKPDPKIPASIQYNSKSTGGGCNKGHMLGSAERLSSAATNRQVFYYSNIAPQYNEVFNGGGGAWNNLEALVDSHVCKDTLYEVIGCYFDKYTDKYGKTCTPKIISYGGRNDVSCPTMFYYVLLRTKNGNSGKSVTECSANELQCVAFVLRHSTDNKGHEPQAKDMMSVSDLEKITGVTYFANVPNAPKDTFNASDWL